jgi:PAS domain S-box-containing protein
MPNRRLSEIEKALQQLPSDATGVDRDTLLHELHVAHEELLVQNEELTRARETIEEARDHFIELYDFAPNGYFTLDPHGVILRINLTGAAMLGRRRDAVEGMPLLGFAAPEHRQRLLDFFRRCRTYTGGPEVVGEVTIRSGDGQRDVQFLCKPRTGLSGNQPELFTAMIDVTERRMLEAERDAAAREHAALASRLISIQDEERQRIARDLHDNVGQHVTALRLLLEAIARPGSSDDFRNRIAKAHSIVDRLDTQLDFLTSELRPASLDLGAVSAIRQFVDEWSVTFDVTGEFECTGLESLRLNADAETHLYRVVQEALNNVSKHAHARHVKVELARRDHLLVLTISDDGRGFDPSARIREHAQSHGLGLIGMRERAQIINGTVDVRSAPGKGTTIVLQVPESSSLAHAG